MKIKNDTKKISLAILFKGDNNHLSGCTLETHLDIYHLMRKSILMREKKQKLNDKYD